MKLKISLFALLCSLSMSSCVENLQLTEGGITGTGMTAGRITSFGSIYVNGIHYNVDNAAFSRDGSTATGQSDFSVGEYVTVTGSEVVDGEAVATTVMFDSLIRGVVTEISNDGLSLKVMGQSVTTDELSIFHGFESLTELSLGSLLEVSGTRNADDQITASSISLLQQQVTKTTTKFEGTVSGLNTEQKTFGLGDLSIDYSAATFKEGSENNLENNSYVVIRAEQEVVNNAVLASEIIFKSKTRSYDKNKHIEIEGHITAFDSAESFELNGQIITTDDQTIFAGITAAELALDMSVEVEGMINDQDILEASKVSSRQAKGNRIKVDGNLSAIDLNTKSFALNGKTFVIDNTSMLLGDRTETKRQEIITLVELEVGDYVDVEAILLSDASYRVLRLDLGGRQDSFSSPRPDKK